MIMTLSLDYLPLFGVGLFLVALLVVGVCWRISCRNFDATNVELQKLIRGAQLGAGHTP